MDLIEFRKDFLEEVKATAATDGEGSNAAFVNVVMSYLTTAEAFEDFNDSFFVGTGKKNRKLRVDGYCFDEFDLTFNLFISDYTGDLQRETLIKSYATTIFDRLFAFLEHALDSNMLNDVEPSTPVSDLIEMLRCNKDRVRKYRLVLLTDGIMSSRINEIEGKTINKSIVDFQIWDMERLFRVCYSSLGRQDIEIDFGKYTERGIPCLPASIVDNSDYRSYLCIVPGNVLADIYDEYGSQLLEGNVRSFLSTKVAVNKKIRETILSSPKNFFAFNNGVSATASNIVLEETQNGIVLKRADDFQIINGGQTTASLSNARFKDKADLSSIYVQMKLTGIEAEADIDKTSELVRNISRSSNSQNKVSDADFFATHPFHIRMEQISRRLYAPATGGAQFETKWFYERARGQYLQSQMRMTKSQKDKFKTQNPKSQLITKTDLAKYRNSWDMKPHIVSKGAQTNFMKFAESVDTGWSNNDKNYNERYFKDIVSLAILFKRTEYIVSHQQWYENGYRANIVTYAIALLHKLIKEQFPDKDLDLQQIWNKQEVPLELERELVVLTKYVFERITDPSRGAVNVTQWCKKDDCWRDIKTSEHILSNDLKKVLIGESEVKKANREAKDDQKLISDLDMQSKVIILGADFWRNVDEFTRQKGFSLTIGQKVALEAALKIPKQIPSSIQCKTLLKLLDLLKGEGFSVDN